MWTDNNISDDSLMGTYLAIYPFILLFTNFELLHRSQFPGQYKYVSLLIWNDSLYRDIAAVAVAVA